MRRGGGGRRPPHQKPFLSLHQNPDFQLEPQNPEETAEFQSLPKNPQCQSQPRNPEKNQIQPELKNPEKNQIQSELKNPEKEQIQSEPKNPEKKQIQSEPKNPEKKQIQSELKNPEKKQIQSEHRNPLIESEPKNRTTQSEPSTSRPASERPNRRNSRWAPRNRLKSRFVEVGSVERERRGKGEVGSSEFVERDDFCGKESGVLVEVEINRIGEKVEDGDLEIMNRRNSRWAPRNRPELRFVEVDSVEEGERRGKGEVGSSESVERSDLCGKEEEKGSGFLSEVETDPIGGKIEDHDSVENRLEELLLGAEEPELSEEVLRINDQLQDDEVLAMESIYGDNVFILDKQRGLLSFQIHIHLEAPGEFKISAKLSSHGDLQAKDTSLPDELLYSFQVQYLPPIILTCLLPKSYPSHMPPHFTISVQWLDSEKISKFCSMLDLIWEEQKGQEVIYRWVDWLQNSSLSYLEFDNEIVLGPYGVRHERNTHAISGSISPEVDIPSLKNYNDEQRHESFCKNFQECCICYSEYAGSDFIRLPCQHFFCSKCMKTYSDMHIKEGTLSKLLCPETKCGEMVPPGLLKRLLGDDEFERWESLMLQKTLDSMSDVSYCPRCETACIEDEENHAQCSKCFFSFCTLCRDRRHVGVSCMTPEMKLKLLQDRQNFNQLSDDHKRRELELINEILNVKEILRDAKQCPSCNMAISRIEGCNKMVCNNCGNYFCYRCNRAIDGYEHFRNGTCELFPQEELQQGEVRNPRQVAAEIQAQLFANNGHLCPLCRQINIKMGNNNHIFCWACQNHYCYLCRKLVKRSAQHFGPKGCKQHTAG